MKKFGIKILSISANGIKYLIFDAIIGLNLRRIYFSTQLLALNCVDFNFRCNLLMFFKKICSIKPNISCQYIYISISHTNSKYICIIKHQYICIKHQTHMRFNITYITNTVMSSISKKCHQTTPNITNICKSHNESNFTKVISIQVIYHLSLIVVSITSVVAPAIRLPGTLLTRRKPGHEQLHLSPSSLQTGDLYRSAFDCCLMASTCCLSWMVLGSLLADLVTLGTSTCILSLVTRPNVSRVTRILTVLSSLPSATATS